jgi:hypothetical protein
VSTTSPSPRNGKTCEVSSKLKKHENFLFHYTIIILQAGASSAAHESEIEQMKRKASGNWTLEGDAFLLGFMKNISNVRNTHRHHHQPHKKL